jgi:hypothetical protein
MPLTSPSNNYIVGIAEQSAEGTVPTIEEYGMPVFSGTPRPQESVARVAVTDASSIDGDPYKQGDQHWTAEGLVFPGFAASTGRLLACLWPTDTASGTTPKTHTFSALGSATPWITMYHTDILAGAVEWTYEAGQCAGMSFSADETGGPLRIGFEAVGKRPTVATYTNATPQSISTDGYFTVKGATLKYEADSATPATETNIQSFNLGITRPVTPMATADGQSVAYLAIGKISFEFTMTMLKDDHEMLRGAYFGTVSGSTPSLTIPTGSVEINCVHSSQPTWSFKLTIPKVALFEEPLDPDPEGGPLVATVTGHIFRPATGDHVQPVLINAVSAAY